VSSTATRALQDQKPSVSPGGREGDNSGAEPLVYTVSGVPCRESNFPRLKTEEICVPTAEARERREAARDPDLLLRRFGTGSAFPWSLRMNSINAVLVRSLQRFTPVCWGSTVLVSSIMVYAARAVSERGTRLDKSLARDPNSGLSLPSRLGGLSVATSTKIP